MTRILLTNDDGVTAPGLLALATALRAVNFDVTVLAPDRNWSASGHVKTLHRPLRVSPALLADPSLEIRRRSFGLRGPGFDGRAGRGL